MTDRIDVAKSTINEMYMIVKGKRNLFCDDYHVHRHKCYVYDTVEIEVIFSLIGRIRRYEHLLQEFTNKIDMEFKRNIKDGITTDKETNNVE